MDLCQPAGRGFVPGAFLRGRLAGVLRVQRHHPCGRPVPPGGGFYPGGGDGGRAVGPEPSAGLVPGHRVPLLRAAAAHGLRGLCEHHCAPGGHPMVCLRRDAEDAAGHGGHRGHLRGPLRRPPAAAVCACADDPGAPAVRTGRRGERPPLAAHGVA